VPEIYCVRAESGRYADQFKNGGYVAIGWFPGYSLTSIPDRDGIQRVYRDHHPGDTSPYAIGVQVGQVARFLFDIRAGDFVVTPTANSDLVYWGVVNDEPYRFVESPLDGCPQQHHRPVDWNDQPVRRSLFSVPLQNTMRSSLTVFQIAHKVSFFEAIGRSDLVSREAKAEESATEMVLGRILDKLDAAEFEVLVTDLLGALGFEAERVGRTGDGGVDAEGNMDVYNVAKIKLYGAGQALQAGQPDRREYRQGVEGKHSGRCSGCVHNHLWLSEEGSRSRDRARVPAHWYSEWRAACRHPRGEVGGA
jgi:hypothetical protein